MATRSALRTCQAAVVMFSRAASARCSARLMRLPRLPIVSMGRSKESPGNHGDTALAALKL